MHYQIKEKIDIHFKFKRIFCPKIVLQRILWENEYHQE